MSTEDENVALALRWMLRRGILKEKDVPEEYMKKIRKLNKEDEEHGIK